LFRGAPACSTVVDLVGDLVLLHAAVRRLDEAERVDPREGRERSDQADVRALGGLDGAHPAVVAGVHVAHLDARALAGEAAGAERREAALVGEARERVVLVHELRELAHAEELLDRGDDGSHVDQGLRRDRLDVLGGHPLADDALHPGQARADLVLDELADGADAAVAEVVDVVGLDADLRRLAAADALDRDRLVGLDRHAGGARVVQGDEVADGRDDVLEREHLDLAGHLDAELAVDLVAADLGEVVALRVEVEVVQERARRLGRDLVARAQLAVDVAQRLLLGEDGVLLQRRLDRAEASELAQDRKSVV